MKPRSRGAFCPSSAKNLDPPQIGGRRKGRVPARTRGPSREKIRAKARSPQVAAENTPAFPAQWFYGLYALSLASQCLIATIAAREAFGACARLDASVGASGPHDFAVRIRAARQSAHLQPPHPRPAFVTFAIAPLRLGRDGEAYSIDSSFGKSEIFLMRGIDRDLRGLVVGQISCERALAIGR